MGLTIALPYSNWWEWEQSMTVPESNSRTYPNKGHKHEACEGLWTRLPSHGSSLFIFICTFPTLHGTGYLFWGNFIEGKKKNLFFWIQTKKRLENGKQYTRLPSHQIRKLKILSDICFAFTTRNNWNFLCLCVWLIKQLF